MAFQRLTKFLQDSRHKGSGHSKTSVDPSHDHSGNPENF